jgi:hypothetical protein
MSDDASAGTGFLPFLVLKEEPDDQQTMGGLFRRGDAEVVMKNIPVEILRKNLRRTVTTLRSLFDELDSGPEPVKLREAQISLEVSASGGIQLIGTAAVGAKGAITLVFRQD